MKSMMKNCLCAMLCAVSLSAFAANNGCQIQGAQTGNGFRQVLNYCLVNKGESGQIFKQMCQDLFQGQGGWTTEKGEENTLTLKFVSSCPSATSGVCEGIFGYKTNLLLLPGNDWYKTVSYKQFCEISEGKWKP